MVKNRGLKEAREKLGNIEKIIENLLKKKNKILIFESGCGYGRLMMDLQIKYGNKVEIIGMNLIQLHGKKSDMIDNVLKEKILSKEEIKKIKIPKIIYGDAGEKLPFKTGSVDLVLSQTSTYLYKDKLHFFEEVARILNKKGVARITLPESKAVPDEFQPLIKIFDRGKEIELKKLINKNMKLVKTSKGKAIEIISGKLNFGFKLEASINLNKLNKKLFGVQSIYYKK
jgi:SAM-dependent methyltransferase